MTECLQGFRIPLVRKVFLSLAQHSIHAIPLPTDVNDEEGPQPEGDQNQGKARQREGPTPTPFPPAFEHAPVSYPAQREISQMPAEVAGQFRRRRVTNFWIRCQAALEEVSQTLGHSGMVPRDGGSRCFCLSRRSTQ